MSFWFINQDISKILYLVSWVSVINKMKYLHLHQYHPMKCTLFFFYCSSQDFVTEVFFSVMKCCLIFVYWFLCSQLALQFSQMPFDWGSMSWSCQSCWRCPDPKNILLFVQRVLHYCHQEYILILLHLSINNMLRNLPKRDLEWTALSAKCLLLKQIAIRHAILKTCIISMAHLTFIL